MPGVAAATPDLKKTALVATLVDAYEQYEMETRRYVLTVVLPSFALVPLAVGATLVLPVPGFVGVPVVLLGVLGSVAALVYPKLVLERRKHEMESRLHLLITHITVLSTTNIDRMAVFRTLAAEEEYGELAVEMRRVVQLVDTWNQSLDDACRIRARQVPSKPLSDFLDRLAYSLEAGQGLNDFLLSEQSAVIQQYVTVYRGALDNLEVMKDLYLSMVLSLTFGLVFAVVLPVLTGTDPTTTVAAVITMYVFVQGAFAYAIRTVAPTDPLWYHPPETRTGSERALDRALAVGVLGSVLLLGVVAADMAGALPVALASLTPFEELPTPIYVAIPVTPLVLPGWVARTHEAKVKERDREYPNFIRALGASESIKQSTTSVVLEKLRDREWGELTRDIDNLYKRLNMRIEPVDAWRLFTAEARSHLVQTFSEMYLVGRQMGGDPKRLGELISENMNETLQLRESRGQSTVTLVGLLYGISAASTFAFFIGLEVVAVLAGMDIQTPDSQFQVGQLIHTGIYDVPTIELLLIFAVLFNAMLSSLMIRTIDNGHKLNAYLHFVALTWLGMSIATLTRVMTGTLLNV
jgi:flagellar protein FlaJ